MPAPPPKATTCPAGRAATEGLMPAPLPEVVTCPAGARAATEGLIPAPPPGVRRPSRLSTTKLRGRLRRFRGESPGPPAAPAALRPYPVDPNRGPGPAKKGSDN